MNGRTTEQRMMDEIAREWLAARTVIAAFLAELNPTRPDDEHAHNAAAILARLAHHSPPILTQFQRPDAEAAP